MLTQKPKNPKFIDLPADVIQTPITAFLGTSEAIASLSLINRSVRTFFQEPIEERIFIVLLQAVVDEDIVTIKKILDERPWLLLKQPKENLVIESKLTWQKIYTEKPLEMATKRRQLGMVKVLLPYFDKLENGNKAALAQWKVRELTKEEHEQYRVKMRKLVLVMKEMTTDHYYQNFNYRKKDLMGSIFEKEKNHIDILRSELLPNEAIELDHYFDIEALMLACYKEGFDFDSTTKDQYETYTTLVLGVIQSVLVPELAERFCEGLPNTSYVVQKTPSSSKSFKLRDENETSFYRPSNKDTSGIGFNFYAKDSVPTQSVKGIEKSFKSFQRLNAARTTEFNKLKRELDHKKTMKYSPCSIL